MSFQEFERQHRAKTEELENFFNDLHKASSRPSSSSIPHPKASQPQEEPGPSQPSVESSSVPPGGSSSQSPPLASEPPSESLPDYAEILKERESKQRFQHLRYLIERQKLINATYPPLPSCILSKNGEEDCEDDDDEDPFDAFYDFLYLYEIVYKLNAWIHSLKAPVFQKTEAQKINNFRKALHYEDLREEAYEAIDEFCHIPQYDDSDDNFDDYETSEKDSDQHSP